MGIALEVSEWEERNKKKSEWEWEKKSQSNIK